MINMFIH